MKSWFALLSLLGATLAVGCATSSPRAKLTAGPRIQVEVLVPPSGDMIYEDEVRRVFVDSAREAFRRRGFEGQVDEVHMGADVRAEDPLVTVRLVRWQRTRTGAVECTFSAAIRPPGGEEQSLGLFTSTDPGLGITNRWSLSEAFLHAAEQAAADLWGRAFRSGLLPGISS